MKLRFKPISSITRGPRDTSMELLRIVAMVMVMVLHADFVSLGVPERRFDNFGQGFDTLLRVVFEMASLVSVNVFILISGWYTIKSTVRGFMNFLFQVLFIFLFAFVAGLLLGQPFSSEKLAACFCLTESFWFIKAYAGLYLLAPLLNMYADRASELQLRHTVILFFLYQTVWGFLSSNPSVSDGYSVLSFAGLYLLARYMRLYFDGRRSRSWLALYGLMTLLCVIAFFTFPASIHVVSYANPLVVVGALALTMYFTTLKLPHNHWVNFIAASSFAAFLFHHSSAIMPYYTDQVRRLYEWTPSVFPLITIALLIALYFAVAIVIDQLRIRLWNRWADPVTEGVKKVVARATDPRFLLDLKMPDCRKLSADAIRQGRDLLCLGKAIAGEKIKKLKEIKSNGMISKKVKPKKKK